MVRVLIVDEVDWCSPHQWPGPGREKEGRCTYSENPCRRGHRCNRITQRDQIRERIRGRGDPSCASTLDPVDPKLVPGGHNHLNAGTRTVRPDTLGSSKLRERSATTGVEAMVALDGG